MDLRGTERVDLSKGEVEVNMTKRGKAMTEVGHNRDKISTATENVESIHLDKFGSSFKHLVVIFCQSVSSLFVHLLHLSFEDMGPKKSFYIEIC